MMITNPTMKLTDLIEERQKEVLKTRIYFAFDSEEEADEHMKDVVATSMTLAYEAGQKAERERIAIKLLLTPPTTEDLSGKTEL